MKYLRNALKIFAGSAMALLVMELILRVFFPQELMTPLFEKNLGLPLVLRKSTEGIHSTPEFLVHYRINSQHMREDREIPIEKPDGVFRILVIGGSFAFGSGVERDQTFIAVAERELNRTNPGTTFEVINGACPGWGTAHELVYMENQGFRFEPDLLLVAFHDDDPKDNRLARSFTLEGGKLERRPAPGWGEAPQPSITHKIPLYAFLMQHSHLGAGLSAKLSAYIRKLRTRAAGGGQEKTDILKKEEKPEARWPEEDWMLTSALVGELNEACEDHGVRLAMIHLPYPDMNRAVEREFSAIGEKWGVPHLGLINSLDDGSPMERYYFEGLLHFNLEGHEKVGLETAGFLNGLIRE